jgi:haloacetate dehalogenase
MTEASGLPDLFPGFAERRIEGAAGVEIYLRTGGSGPPLLLLHGYPESHVMWHKVAPDLAHHFTLVIPDLRGYGASSVPMADAEHLAYSKRVMAEDCLTVMRELGHRRFLVAGHDRGARVAYRLALDHPQAVAALVPVDIIPTAEVWRRITAESALRGYHWQFLAQPFPLPETLIDRDPVYYLELTLRSWAGPHDLSPFADEALAHYRAQVQDSERVHAFCEDYRAGASVDRRLDEADLAAGRKIACPTLILHGSRLPTGSAGDPLDAWRAWCSDARAATVAAGHFLAEENPAGTLAALLPFLTAHGGAA